MTLKMTTAQVVETSVTVTNSSFQNYTHPDDHARQTTKLIILTKINNCFGYLKYIQNRSSFSFTINRSKEQRGHTVYNSMFTWSGLRNEEASKLRSVIMRSFLNSLVLRISLRRFLIITPFKMKISDRRIEEGLDVLVAALLISAQ